MAGEFSITSPNERHIAALAELCRETFHAAYRITLPEDELRAYVESTFAEEALVADIRAPDSYYRIAVGPAAEVYGYLKYRIGTMPACVQGSAPVELHRFYVAPGLTGMGIGGRLFTAGETLMKAHGFVTAWLKVWDGNEQAQRMYLKRGYGYCGEEMYPVGREERRVLVMSKSLDEDS